MIFRHLLKLRCACNRTLHLIDCLCSPFKVCVRSKEYLASLTHRASCMLFGRSCSFPNCGLHYVRGRKVPRTMWSDRDQTCSIPIVALLSKQSTTGWYRFLTSFARMSALLRPFHDI